MSHYAGSAFFDRGGRHYNFAKYLKRAGYEPVVMCANSKHGSDSCWYETDALWHEHHAEDIDVPFVFIKARAYAGNGKKRVLNMIDFFLNVKKAAKEYAEKNGKPDVIYASSVHPLTLVAGIQLAKKFGVKCICEVRDLWPESIVAFSKRLTRKNPLIQMLYLGEKWIYKKADKLVFTMAGGLRYIEDHGWDTANGGPVAPEKIYHINNGVDLEVFQKNIQQYCIQDADLDDPSLFTICFAGTLVSSNNIQGMLDLAKRLLPYEKIKFLIWGDGVEKAYMLERIESEGLTNVCYKGVVAKKNIPYIVTKASLNFMHAAPTDLYRYGASPNKLFDYLAAGQPILQDFTYYGDLVKKYNCGISMDWDVEQVADAIYTMYTSDPATIEAMRENCKKAAEQFDFAELTRQLIQVIEEA